MPVEVVVPDSEQRVQVFWSAHEDALFNQKVVAPVLQRSEAWCERARWEGTGPKFIKAGRPVLYRKRDVLDWLGRQPAVHSTSEYQNAA